MNTKLLILLAVGVLIAVTLFVFLKDDYPVIDPHKLSADEQKGLQLLRVAEQTCLSGNSTDANVSIDLSTDLLSKFKANSGVNRDEARGAVNYVDEQVRAIVDKDIRECLQKLMPQIQACLLGDCNAANAVENVEFQFSYKAAGDNPNLMENLVSFGLENRTDNRVLILQPGKGYYVDTVALIPRGETRNAAIFGVVRESYIPEFDARTNLCLSRSEQSNSTDSYTLYHCKQGQGCQHESTSPKLFELCQAAGLGMNHWQFSFFSPAYANSNTRDWAIPALKVLQQRQDLFGIGYTHFKIVASEAINKDYDGFYFDIAINGQPANINGLPGNFRAHSHDFSTPVSIEFGLQNLNFTGMNNGCDDIQLTMNFVRNGELAGAQITLNRSYVALRDARDSTQLADSIEYLWTGKYQRAPKMYDTEVFASSIFISSGLDFATNKSAIKKARHDITKMKTDFDTLELEFEDHPLVAVIRPPLTQTSYGLAIGMVEDTQQIRFTYYNPTAKRLLQFLLGQRSRGHAYASTIRPDSFLYSVRGDKSYMVSPPVCDNNQAS